MPPQRQPVDPMRFQTLILTTLLASSGVTIGLAIRQDRKIARARATLTSILEQREKLVVANGRAVPAAAGVGWKAKTVADQAQASTAQHSGPVIAPTQPAKTALAEIGDPLVNDPALQNLYLAAERADIEILYAPLFRQLGPTRSQIESFQELVMKRHEQWMDLADIQQSHELEPRDPALLALRRKVEEDFEVKQVALLGRAGYLSLCDFERKLPVRQLVNRFAGAAALEGRPLTPSQSDALTNALANASAPYNAGETADPNRVDWPVVLRESATILSEPQQLSFLNMIPRYAADDEAGIIRDAPLPVP
jgi:hypothetical protein